VRQVESKAIRKLQHPVRRQRLAAFLPGTENLELPEGEPLNEPLLDEEGDLGET
jgi:hypothetical protein